MRAHVPGRGERGAAIPAGSVSPRAVAAATGLALAAVIARTERGEVATEPFGTRRLIPEGELRRWLVERRTATPRWCPPPGAEAAWEAALDGLPLAGVKATELRQRFGPVPRIRRAIAAELGLSTGAVARHEAAALRILRDPAFRHFSCGLPRDHPLRRAIFPHPGLEAACGDAG